MADPDTGSDRAKRSGRATPGEKAKPRQAARAERRAAAKKAPPSLAWLPGDSRTVEVTKLAILSLMAAGSLVSRAGIVLAARTVSPPSGRRPGLSESTLDRNASCRALFDAYGSQRELTPLRNLDTIDANIMAQTRGQLWARLHRIRAVAARRRRTLDATVAQIAARGRSIDVSGLEALETGRSRFAANRPAPERSARQAASDRARAGRAAGSVARTIRKLARDGAVTRAGILSALGKLPKAERVSAATLDRGECRRMVDAATGNARPEEPPRRLRHRDLARAVEHERATWRETRRLAFAAVALLADLDDASLRAAAASRAKAHREAADTAERAISASSAAARRATDARSSTPRSMA